MKINSEAIYNTRPILPYQKGKVCFTQNKNDKTIYAIYLAENDEAKIPEKILIEGFSPKPNAKIFLLGSNEKLSWEKVENGFEVEIPESLQNKPPCKSAWVIKISAVTN
jgi:alpha-L-fucosidase